MKLRKRLQARDTCNYTNGGNMIFVKAKANRCNNVLAVRNSTFATVDREYSRIKRKYLDVAKKQMPLGTNCIAIQVKKHSFRFEEGVLFGEVNIVFVKHDELTMAEKQKGWHNEEKGIILGDLTRGFKIKIRNCLGIVNKDVLYLDIGEFGQVDTKLIFFKQCYSV